MVRGRVQGVWFRDSARREAEMLGVTGYAINLENGDVEVLACGSRASLDRLGEWLWRGPPMAQVADVRQAPADYEDLASFRIG